MSESRHYTLPAQTGITRRMFIQMTTGSLMAASLAGCTAVSGKKNPSPRKPNIVFILVDDLGWADTSIYGSRYYQTPHIDALAREGIRFTDAYAACAVCSPTRAAVLTGRYPARIGVTDWIRFLPMHDPRLRGETASQWESLPGRTLACPRNPLWMDLEERTLAEELKRHGYVTAHIGKWHLGSEKYWPEKQGFDINIGGCDLGMPPTYFDPYYSDQYDFGSIETLPPRKEGEYLTDREADEAVRFVREHRDAPFFLYMAHYAVHTPLEAPEDLVKKYENLPLNGQKSPVYAAMIERLDDAVGRITRALDETGLAKNTLVIFTSDNGGFLPATCNAPLRKGKGYPYEGGIREPLIIRWPGTVRPGTVSREVVTSVDFFPTLLEAAGADLPEDRAIDGVSLVSHLLSGGRQSLGREAVYWHFPHYRHKDIVPYSIIRSGPWKLIKYYEGKPFELFNLEKDLGEYKDLSEERPDKVNELNLKLEAWLKNVNARMPKSSS